MDAIMSLTKFSGRQESMYKEIKCLRCDKIMNFLKRDHLQLGKETRWVPGWMNDAFNCDIYICPECGELHFFKAEDDEKNPSLELVKCTFCMKKYDKNYPHCPHCGKKLGEF